MADTKKTKYQVSKFPCGTLEEMLRMMRVYCEKENIDFEMIMKEFIGKDFRNIDYKQIMKKYFDEDSKLSTFMEKK